LEAEDMYPDIRIEILKMFHSQSNFSQAVKIHESKVSQVLNGRRLLRKEESESWAKTLNCDPALLEPVTKY
jgi:hypothetical protein